jgi:hypothetical protein
LGRSSCWRRILKSDFFTTRSLELRSAHIVVVPGSVPPLHQLHEDILETNDIDKVLITFRGTGDRDPDLAIKYMHPTKYTQHNPHASDGIDGVKEWIAQPRDRLRAYVKAAKKRWAKVRKQANKVAA